MNSNKLLSFSPGRIILLSLFGAIFIGALLLSLPCSRNTEIPFIDLFFTATSSLCVTGLFTVSLDQFSLFGQAIILLLIQIGGLGLVTLSLFIMYLFTNMGFTTKLKAGKLLEIDSVATVKKMLVSAFSITLIVEMLGAFVLFVFYKNKLPFLESSFYALFHSVSSFCNAGVLLPYTPSIFLYERSYLFLVINGLLMFIGGIGFITCYEVIGNIARVYKGKRWLISLNSKIILYSTAMLILSSAILFWLFESKGIFSDLDGSLTFLNALFYAISAKSAGMIFINPAHFHVATLFLFMIISFIGSAPTSTGSGIKVTTFLVVLATAKAAITGRSSVELFERTIDRSQVYKSLAIILISISWIICSVVCLSITQTGVTFSRAFMLFFESFSSFTTIGVTLGMTSQLTTVSKIIIMLNMIIGRVGSLTLVFALKLRGKHDSVSFSYPKEQVLLS